MARFFAGVGALVLLAAPGCRAAEGANAVVSTVAQLNSALASAHGGETIRLAPGVYSGLGTKELNYASGVTITSADETHPAVITPFYLSKSANITFSHIEFFTAGSNDPQPFRVYHSKSISYIHDNFHGDLGVPPSSESCTGIRFFSSENISMTENDFSRLRVGIVNDNVSGGVFSDNSFHDMRSDGMDTIESNHILITNNVFTDFEPADGDHPDAMQFWGNRGTTTSPHDFTVDGNLVARGSGRPIQGVFMGGDFIPYQDVIISNNIVVGGHYNAIAVGGAENLKILSNIVAAYSDYGSFIRMQRITGLTVTHNAAHRYLFADDSKVTQSANALNDNTFDGGKALVAKWLRAHPGWAGTFPASLSRLVGAKSTASAVAGSAAPDAVNP